MLQKISNLPKFKKGVQDFKENKVEKHKTNYNWVKKLISNKEWNTKYAKENFYCFLKKEDNNIWIGFLISGYSKPVDCELCSDEELRQIDECRRARGLYPRPFKNL